MYFGNFLDAGTRVHAWRIIHARGNLKKFVAAAEIPDAAR